MLSQVIKGASYTLKGFQLIKLPGVRRYVIIPALINIFLFLAAIWYGIDQIDTLIDQYLPRWLMIFEPIIKIFFLLASALIIFFTFTIIANIFGAPFNGVLSEKIEKHLCNEKISTGEGYIELLKGAGVGLSNTFVKLMYIVARIIPLLILFIIPGLNLFAPFLMFIFGAWMLAIEYVDYPMGNRNMHFKKQLSVMKENRFMCLGFGMALFGMTIIPVLNFFAMPVGVAAATALWVDELKTV